jgi:hypothetical protein
LFKKEVTYLCTKQGSLFCFVWHAEISQTTMVLHAVLLASLGSWGALTLIDTVLSYGVKAIDY